MFPAQRPEFRSSQTPPRADDEKRDSTAATVFHSDSSSQHVVNNKEQEAYEAGAELDSKDAHQDKVDLEKGGDSDGSNSETKQHDWYGDDDPEHPHNWPLAKKLGMSVMLALVTFSISINSAMFSPAVMYVAQEMQVSTEVATLGTSLYLLGFGAGPPLWGPISEKFGRKWPLLIGSGGAALFTFMPAFGKNMPAILIGRFISGCFGASPATIVSGASTDNWGPVGRGISLTVAVGTIFAGPLLAPVIGGFVVAHLNWRWCMYLMIILGGVISLAGIFLLPETYPAVLLKQRAAKLRKSTGDQSIKAPLDTEKTDFAVIKNIYLIRPWRLFATEPILVLVTIYQAFIYGIVYLFTSAYPFAFANDRHWAPGIASLPIVSLHVGIFIAVGITVVFLRKYIGPRVAAAGGKVVPEDRLPLMMFGAVLFPIGLFWFAWTAGNPNVHWIVPILSGGVIGCGMFCVFIQCIGYLIEVYLKMANSAMASNGLVRSLFGAGFSLLAPVMYNNLGVAWATSTLGFCAVAMIPIPVLFYIFGAKVRSWSKNTASSGSGK